MHLDSGFQAAFGFLVGLATHGLPATTTPGICPNLDLSTNPSPLRLSQQLGSWVDEHSESLEYAALAKRAAADCIASWTRDRSRQHDLFGSERSASQLWTEASTGAAFSDLCRAFFARFVERYVKYFLDREASAKLGTVVSRERFAASIAHHADLIARHAFETTRITQSFAAGWFNKNARDARPDQASVAAFLSFALGKVRQELDREAAPR